MLKSVRTLMVATFLGGSASVAAPAAAQDIELSGNAAIVSEYRFRGVDLSGGDIAVQGGVDAAIGGFYIGTWGSSIDEDTVSFGHTELDVYGGWGTDIGDTVSFDIGVIAYLYPNADNAVIGDTDYIEFYSSISAALGPAEIALGIAYAPEQESLGDDDNFYIFTDLGIGIPDSPLSISGHLGYTDGFLTFTDDSKAFDWSLGVDVALGDVVSVGAAYVGAEGDIPDDEYDFTDDAFVLTLAAAF